MAAVRTRHIFLVLKLKNNLAVNSGTIHIYCNIDYIFRPAHIAYRRTSRGKIQIMCEMLRYPA